MMNNNNALFGIHLPVVLLICTLFLTINFLPVKKIEITNIIRSGNYNERTGTFHNNDKFAFEINSVIPATAVSLAESMGIRPTDIISASLNGSDSRGVGVGITPFSNHFPTEGSTFAILSTGLAESASWPNNEGNLSFILDGLKNSQGNDVVQLDLVLSVPENMNCASFDFQYLSEEFPEWIGSQYNDTFTAELGGTDLIIEGNQVIAPLNFAFDLQGSIISVNTVFGVDDINATGTTYDGATPLLRARTAVTPGTNINIVFSVQDLGDSIYDSAVFIDKFFWSDDPDCGSGTLVDTDGDGLLDIWETEGLTVSVNGVDVFLDLPAMGADPMRKDIFVEIDYMVKPGYCIPFTKVCFLGHSHQPKPEAIAKIVEAFANAPVLNPDGSMGINLHVDYGPESIMNPLTGELWGSLSEANSLLPIKELGSSCGDNCYDWSDFDVIKLANFSQARAPVFRYVVFAHQLGDYNCTSGISRGAPGSDLIVSLGGWGIAGSGGCLPGSEIGVGTVNQQAGTFMHELGHNLGLRHGGENDDNYKPNYLSIMNYFFQTRGLIVNGTEGHFDYSYYNLPDLNENDLNETVGLNGGSWANNYGTKYFCPNGNERIVKDQVNNPVDWNCNGNKTETQVQADINNDTHKTILSSFSDWNNIVFTGGAIGQPGAKPNLPMETEIESLTEQEDAELISLYNVVVGEDNYVKVSPGKNVLFTILVVNRGINEDTYTLNSLSSSNWSDLNGLPTTITLNPGERIEFDVIVYVPHDANTSMQDNLTIIVVSETNPHVMDSVILITGVSNEVFLPVLQK
jgi:hypothetical protein